jgi:hypothetical protein
MHVAGVAQPHFAPNVYNATGFVQEHDRRYRAIWDILGWEWVNLYLAAAQAVNTIPGKEHGILKPDFMITDKQFEAIFEQLKDMKWYGGLQLRPGSYNNLLMTGAKYGSMVIRANTLMKRLNKEAKPHEVVKFERIFGLFGQRPRTVTSDGTVDDIYGSLTDKVKAHRWVIEQMALQQLPNANDEWGGAFATEFEMGILSMIVATDGDLMVGTYEPCFDSESLPGVPLRTVESCTLTLPDGTVIVAINAPAVVREYGPPRPTSISTTRHWMESYGVESGDTVVVITVRVHGRRIVGDVERLIHSIDPSVTVLGYVEGVKGDPREFFNQGLGETVNQLVKAVEESLNQMRPASSPPLDQKAVREFLNRLYKMPTMETLLQIFNEVVTA